MIDTIDDKNRLFELKDKSILHWLAKEDQGSIIEEFQYKSVQKNHFFQDKINPSDLVILISGKASIISNESNSVFETIVPGKSFELNKHISGITTLNKWVAEEDSVIGLVNFEILKSLLIKADNFEYLKRISFNVEFQKLKNDLRMLGISSHLFKEIISAFEQIDGEPEENELCIISSGEMTFTHPSEGNQLNRLRISDYLIWKKTEIPCLISDGIKFWRLPKSYEFEKKIDSSLYSFFDVINELEQNLKKNEDEIEEDQQDEPLDLDDFEISHFQATNTVRLLRHRSKPVALRQHDAMDCGAACMAMISQYYKRKITISTWRRLIHVTREGASMLSIKIAADKVGIDTIGIMSGTTGLMSFTTPFIALMAYHYVVIYKISDDGVILGDPARGLIKISLQEFKKDFSSNCLLTRPNDRLLKYPETPPAYKKYLGLFKPHFGDFLQISIFSSLLFFLNLATPLFTQYIFDTVLPSGKTDSIKMVSIIAIVFSLFVMLLSTIRLSFLIKIASIISLKLSSLFFRQIMRLPFGYFTVRNVGDITTRVDELDRIRSFFTNNCIQILLNLLAVGIYSTILLIYHPYFSYLIVLSLLVAIFIMSPLFKKVKEEVQDLFHSMGSANSVTFEQFSSLRTIQNISGTLQARWRWEEKQSKALDKRQNIQVLNASTMSISTILQQLIDLSFLSLAIYLFLDRKITIGQVVAATTISGMIIGPMLELVQSVDDIGQLKVSFEKIDEIVTSKVEDESAGKSFKNNFNTIEFKDIWFKYGSDASPWILKGINFEVKRGQKIAFVGPSGSGKSTISYMLNLIYQPQKGEVFIDGVKNTEIGLNDLRANISMIVQDNSVLMGTVLSNIALGDTSPNLVKATEAARLADAHDFIMSLPQGYQTLIGGEHGTSMSGGQKQRISIARAIYKEPSIIIMDEATSALDTITEKKVMNNLYQKLKNTTCFIIAHRFNTIMNADVIVVVKDGKIKEIGNHDVLMKKQQIYYNMFKKQISH